DHRRIIAMITRSRTRSPYPRTGQDDVVMKTGIETNSDIFDCIKHTAAQKIAAKLLCEQGALEADGSAGPAFVVDALETLIIRFVMVELGQQAQLASQKPRFFKSDRDVFSLRSELDAEAEL